MVRLPQTSAAASMTAQHRARRSNQRRRAAVAIILSPTIPYEELAMFSNTAKAAILAVMLACTAAQADTSNPSDYQMPAMFETLVTGGASYDGSFTDEQFAAYCLTFGMTLAQSWDNVVPSEFNDRAFPLLAGLVFLGGDVNKAANEGNSDAEAFMQASQPDSADTQMVVRVLMTLIAE
jgi:hypothetical protein